MINLMLRGIITNAEKIEDVIEYIQKMNKKNAIQFILIALGLLTTTKVITNQNERIKSLEIKLKDISSKGE